MSTVTKDLYAVGEAPPLGVVPPTMHAHDGTPRALRRAEGRVPAGSGRRRPEIGPRECWST